MRLPHFTPLPPPPPPPPPHPLSTIQSPLTWIFWDLFTSKMGTKIRNVHRFCVPIVPNLKYSFYLPWDSVNAQQTGLLTCSHLPAGHVTAIRSTCALTFYYSHLAVIGWRMGGGGKGRGEGGGVMSGLVSIPILTYRTQSRPRCF